jgi:mitochondrial-processing peptidase subunit alpha
MWKWAHGMFEAETPMATPLAGLDAPAAIDPAHPGPVSVTALPNGVRVASQDLGGPVTALGVFVGAGSRHETTYTAGSTHVLEHLAFKGSAARSKFRMIRDVERTGAMFSAAASRESIAFSAETLPRHAPEVVSILAECATKPAVAVTAYGTPEWDSATAEIAEHVVAIKNELKEFSADPSGQVTEAMHAAAYHGNTLGTSPISSPFFPC